MKKTATEKEPITALDVSTEDLAPQSCTLPDELPLTGKRTEEIERGDNHEVGQNVVPLLSGGDSVGFERLDMSTAEIIRQEKAASKVQATFRGYLVMLSLLLVHPWEAISTFCLNDLAITCAGASCISCFKGHNKTAGAYSWTPS